jgi:DNA-binding NtrC family response regulator
MSVPEQQRRPRIFVVDDEPVIAETLAVILRQSNFDARAFTDPQEALQVARSTAPNLVISDVIMPELSGTELAMRIQKLYPNCKVLLFSGRASSADLLVDALARGYDFELLLKPVHPSDLLRSIERVFDVMDEPSTLSPDKISNA